MSNSASWPNWYRSARLIVVLTASGGTLMLIAYLMYSMSGPAPPSFTLPSKDKVKSIRASLFKGEVTHSSLTNVLIPPDYYDSIYKLLLPAKKMHSRFLLGDLTGKLDLEFEESTVTILFYFTGKTPFYYSIDGAEYFRDGPFEPCLGDRKKGVWGAESLMLVRLICEIDAVSKSKNDRQLLDETIDHINKSTGGN